MATDSICTVAAVMCNGSGGGGASATSPTTTHTSQDCSPCSPDTCSTSTNSTVNTTTTATTVDNKQQQHTDDDSQIMFETSSPNANTATDLHTEDDVDDDDVEEDEEEEDNYDDDDDDAVAVVTVEPITKVEVVRDDDDEEVEEEEEAEDYNYDEDGDNNEVGAVPTEIHDEVDTHTDGLSLNEQHMYFDSTESIDDDQSSCRFKVLEYDQLLRLVEVMEATIPIHGRGNFPTLDVKLKDLIQLVRQKLKSEGVHVRDMRLNGGAASYVLEIDTSQSYNDLDLIFGIDLSNQNELQKVKNCVLGCLLDFLPAGVSKDRMSSSSLKEAYVQKMVKVCNEHGDRWSLISLSNKKGKNVELKFVDKMKRQFEFSVDSFQIILDSLLTFYEVSNTPTSEHFYPSVKAESVYGDFSQAWFHLTEKLIATRNPEEIRGGGLLKYCNLLVRRYTPAGNVDIRAMERYMCSRFFIDFSDLSQQKQKLDAYLANHFSGEEDLKYEYLMTLYRVVDDSTICLMGHERRQTLNLIHRLACEIFLEQEQKAQSKYLQLPQFDNSNNLILDQVFYGPYNNTNGGSQYYSYLPFYQVGNTSISSCPLCPQPYLQCS